MEPLAARVAASASSSAAGRRASSDPGEHFAKVTRRGAPPVRAPWGLVEERRQLCWMRSIFAAWSSGASRLRSSFRAVGSASRAFPWVPPRASRRAAPIGGGGRLRLEEAKLPVDGLSSLRLQVQEIEIVADPRQAEAPSAAAAPQTAGRRGSGDRGAVRSGDRRRRVAAADHYAMNRRAATAAETRPASRPARSIRFR